MDNGEYVTGTGHLSDETFEGARESCTDGNICQEGDERDNLGTGRGAYGQMYAKIPVTNYAPFYKMDHPNRGIAYIFNHEKFETENLENRSGTNEDCKNLKATLIALNFKVHEFKDLNYSDIKLHIETASKMDHTNNDCILIAILSHGGMGTVYAKDRKYKPEHICSYFTADKCPTLAGKPKMFFFQACQGKNLDGGVNMVRTETDGDPQNTHTYNILVQPDFLIVSSTVKGYLSWRNKAKGSWFIQSLCDELRQRALTDHLLTILTFVSQRVAVDFESNVPRNSPMHRKKQIPCVMSMLTRLIKFSNDAQSTR